MQQFPSDEALKDALNCALRNGCRHFDTAFSFENEVSIGEVIDEWIKSGQVKRSELFITTKVKVHRMSVGMGPTLSSIKSELLVGTDFDVKIFASVCVDLVF